ncbi:hypothetical protein RRG08_013865 [Elysia crispata]|uniref:Uncharacterized protein n=1 Tax=Elysia crispata TaxID=231223 RepID=A0AAE0YL44_9GAST|nr:hypothetical protein RRG08_013865 [Elysia crispata]
MLRGVKRAVLSQSRFSRYWLDQLLQEIRSAQASESVRPTGCLAQLSWFRPAYSPRHSLRLSAFRQMTLFPSRDVHNQQACHDRHATSGMSRLGRAVSSTRRQA